MSDLITCPLSPIRLRVKLGIVKYTSPGVFCRLSTKLRRSTSSIMLNIKRGAILTSGDVVCVNSYTSRISCGTLFRGLTIGGVVRKFAPRRVDELLSLRTRLGAVVRSRV